MRHIIKVWCVDPKTSEQKLKDIHDKVAAAFKAHEIFKVNGKIDLLLLFPSDLMKYGVGTEILVEIEFITGFDPKEFGEKVRAQIEHDVQSAFPEAEVDCRVVGRPVVSKTRTLVNDFFSRARMDPILHGAATRIQNQLRYENVQTVEELMQRPELFDVFLNPQRYGSRITNFGARTGEAMFDALRAAGYLQY